MFHWLIIILGIVLLASSISNPFYKILFAKFFVNIFFFKLITRALLLVFGIILVIFGLYIESIS